ncbi:MAG: hypothetical protein M1829_002606 [Trizodia sp. TS-e1964]|nr:MAG: hypothetical protein M1829_002606 [Trizodia sp. TS-e1964]
MSSTGFTSLPPARQPHNLLTTFNFDLAPSSTAAPASPPASPTRRHAVMASSCASSIGSSPSSPISTSAFHGFTFSQASMSSMASLRLRDALLKRRPSLALLEMEEERRAWGPELKILEPRPMVYWGGLEERMEL